MLPEETWKDFRLYVANFTRVEYSEDGTNQPIDMTVDEAMPRYQSSLINRFASFEDGHTAKDLWVMWDEAECARGPSWSSFALHLSTRTAKGLPPRLLVPSVDGERMLCIRDVVEPDFSGTEPESSLESDSEDEGEEEDDGGDIIMSG